MASPSRRTASSTCATISGLGLTINEAALSRFVVIE